MGANPSWNVRIGATKKGREEELAEGPKEWLEKVAEQPYMIFQRATSFDQLFHELLGMDSGSNLATFKSQGTRQ